MQVGSGTIDTGDKFWSAATVAAAVDAKKAQRQNKERASNCFTVRYYDTDAPEGTPESKKFELETLLKNLKESVEKGNFSTNNLETNRFQVMVQNGAHWTPLDFTIKDNKLHVLSIDSASSPTEIDSITAIKKYFPDATIYSLGPSCMVQMDDNSCSRFSLDVASKIQNIPDPISLIERHASESKPRELKDYGSKFTGRFIQLETKDVPNEMAFVFRNVQSGTALNKLPERLLDSPVNKTGVTLRDYAEKNAQTQEVNGQQKKRYTGIETVKTKLVENTRQHLETVPDDQKAQIRERSKGTDFITAPQAQRQQMNAQQKQTVAPDIRRVALAKEHVRTTPEPKGFFSHFSKTHRELKKSEKIIELAQKSDRSKVQEPPKEEKDNTSKKGFFSNFIKTHGELKKSDISKVQGGPPKEEKENTSKSGRNRR